MSSGLKIIKKKTDDELISNEKYLKEHLPLKIFKKIMDKSEKN